MKITQEVRDYAEQKGLAEEAAVEEGMREKAKQFQKGGGKIYS